MATPTAIAIRSAAVRKILIVRENLGGSGGGSFNPRMGMFSLVAAGAGVIGCSVALIVRRRRGIVLAVLVLVGLRRKTGHVQRDGHLDRGPGPDRNREGLLAGLLVPGLEGVGARGHRFEPERSVSGGDCRVV